MADLRERLKGGTTLDRQVDRYDAAGPDYKPQLFYLVQEWKNIFGATVTGVVIVGVGCYILGVL